MLLNAQQNESCGILEFRRGAGLLLFLHKPESQPNFYAKPVTMLQPGYMYTVSMKSVKTVMETAFLGRCTNKFQSIWKADVDDYNEKDCLMECYTEHVWKKCKCLQAGVSATDKLAKNFGKKRKEDINSCISSLNSLQCSLNVVYDFGNAFKITKDMAKSTCPKCNRKCVDTTYETTITATKFSSQFLREIYSVFRADEAYMRKTLLLVEFQFEEMVELTITESPMFTGRDLFVYIGGTAGLFWGASTLTMYEIVHQIAYSISFYVIAFFKRSLKETMKRMKNCRIRRQKRNETSKSI